MFKLRNLSYSYGTDAVLFVDALDIPPTGITAVIGSSGSGKTTLLSVLAGFLQSSIDDEGSFTFDGRPAGPELFRPGEVGFIFQSPMLLGAASGSVNMLAGHAVAQRDANSPLDRADLAEIIDKLGLFDPGGALLSKRARKLSGGQAQRVAVLRAILTDPEVILCDEPTSSLDAHNATQVMEALQLWSKERKRPVVWVTHNLAEAAQYADNYVFLAEGRIAPPLPEQAAALVSDDRAVRLGALQQIASTIERRNERPPPNNSSDADKVADEKLRVLPGAFTGWIVRALSSNGCAAELFERRNPVALAAPGHVGLMRNLTAGGRSAPSFWFRFRNLLFSYPRFDLIVLLSFLFLQMFVAFSAFFIAKAHYAKELENPALWRVTFSSDPLSAEALDQGIEAEPLNYPVLESISAGIAEALADETMTVAVFGRRFSETSIRIPGSERCTEWLSVETLIIENDDPILNLAEFSGAPGPASAPDGLQRDAPAAPAFVDAHTIFLDENLYSVVQENCMAPGAERVSSVEWTPVDALRGEPLSVSISEWRIDRLPPVHPYFARMIVPEAAYQDVYQRTTLVRGAGNFDQASVFLPQGGFDDAEALLKQRGYSVSDDSRAVVAELQRVAAFVEIVPIGVAGLNAVVVVIIALVVVSSQLELNSRVLTLFFAHGYRSLDIIVFVGRHLFPAAIVALLAMWALGLLVVRPVLASSLPIGSLSFVPELIWALVAASVVGLLAFVMSVVSTTGVWGDRTRLRLTEKLRD